MFLSICAECCNYEHSCNVEMLLNYRTDVLVNAILWWYSAVFSSKRHLIARNSANTLSNFDCTSIVLIGNIVLYPTASAF